MNATEAVRKLEAGSEFAEWKKGSKDAFLSSIFAMFDKEHEGEWLISYYIPSAKKTTTFFVDELETLKKGEDDADKAPRQLDMGKVKVELADALEAANTFSFTETIEEYRKGVRLLEYYALILPRPLL